MVYLENSGFEYSETTAYRDFLANRPENLYDIRTNYYINEARDGCVIATRDYRPGEIIQNCTGSIVTLTEEDRKWLETETRDFSILYSHRKGSDCLFLGPARFVNHDCDPNCEFSAAGAQSITFKVIKHIKAGDEITVYYSDSYFGDDNKDCLCSQCRLEKSSSTDNSQKSSPKRRYNFRSKSNRQARSTTPTHMNIVSETGGIASPCSIADDISDVCVSHKNDSNQINQISQINQINQNSNTNQTLKPPSPSSVTTSIAPGDGVPIDSLDSTTPTCEWCSNPILFTSARSAEPSVCQRCLRHFKLFATVWPVRPETVKDPKRCLVQFFNEYVKEFSNTASTTRSTRISKAALDPSLSATSKAALEFDNQSTPVTKIESVEDDIRKLLIGASGAIIESLQHSNGPVTLNNGEIIDSSLRNGSIDPNQAPPTTLIASEIETLQPALLSAYYNQHARTFVQAQSYGSDPREATSADDAAPDTTSVFRFSDASFNSDSFQQQPTILEYAQRINSNSVIIPNRLIESLNSDASSSRSSIRSLPNVQIIRSSSPNNSKITLKITNPRIHESNQQIDTQPTSPIHILSSPTDPIPYSVDNMIKSMLPGNHGYSNEMELVDIEANDNSFDLRGSNIFYSSNNNRLMKNSARHYTFNDTIPIHMLQSRIAVLVDPLDEELTPWWPAILVPDNEVDDTMGYPNGPPPGMRLVRYFEDSSYSICSINDIRLFTPPYGTYAKCLERSPSLAHDSAYRKACAFLDHGIVPLNLPWPEWRKEMVLTGIRPFGRSCSRKYTYPVNTPVHVWDPRSPKKIENAVIRDIEFLDNPIRHGLYYYVHYPKWGRKFDEWIRPTNLILDEELSKVQKTMHPVPPPRICNKKYRKTIYDHCMSHDLDIQPVHPSKRQSSKLINKNKKLKKST
jgi:hypothetical protein